MQQHRNCLHNREATMNNNDIDKLQMVSIQVCEETTRADLVPIRRRRTYLFEFESTCYRDQSVKTLFLNASLLKSYRFFSTNFLTISSNHRRLLLYHRWWCEWLLSIFGLFRNHPAFDHTVGHIDQRSVDTRIGQSECCLTLRIINSYMYIVQPIPLRCSI